MKASVANRRVLDAWANSAQNRRTRMLSAPSMFNAPSVAHDSKADSTYIQPTLNHGLRIWWAYYWPTTIVAGLLTFCTALWLRMLYENLAISAPVFSWSARLQGYVLTYLVAIFGINYVLRRRFRRFRIALLPVGGDASSPALPVTVKRGLRVWWTFSWRTLVYGVIGYLLILLPLTWFAGIFAPRPSALVILFFGLVSIAVNGAVSLFVVYSNILEEDFGDFRVVLLPREAAAQTPMAAHIPPQTQATA